MSIETRESHPKTGGDIELGRLSDKLTKEQEKRIQSVVSQVREAFYDAAGDGEKEYPKGYGIAGGTYVKKAKAGNPRTVVADKPAQVKYKRKETGHEVWQGAGNTANTNVERVEETLKIKINPDAEDEAVFEFDFLREPVDEVTVLAAGLRSSEGRKLSDEEQVDFVLSMLGDAAKSVEEV